MTLSPKLGVVGISTLWHFRLPLPIQMFIKVASSPRLSGIGMPSPILWYHSLKMQRIVLLSSLLWWELGTNSLITGPGEWLSFRRFTSKLSWSWSWSCSSEHSNLSVVYRFMSLLYGLGTLTTYFFFCYHREEITLWQQLPNPCVVLLTCACKDKEMQNYFSAENVMGQKQYSEIFILLSLFAIYTKIK